MKTLFAALALAAALGAFAEPPAAPKFRLGDAAAPKAYDVTLAIDPRQERFEGEVRIDLRFERATPRLWMNAQGLEILEAHFTQGGRRAAAKATPAGTHFVAFETEGGFEAGEALAQIRYRGALENVGTRGLFRQAERGEWYAMTQFEALNARRAFPCFDEPHWKTPWRVTIDAPAGDGAFANTPQESHGPAPGREGWTRHVFAPTQPLPTYLVAFAVGPFEAVEGGTAGIGSTPLRHVVTKGRGGDTRFVREVTPALLAHLEDYFGRPFPFAKLDSLTIPATVGFGAMENVGLITYASNLMLMAPARESLAFKVSYASIGSHEIAHQWFGNLVTMAWWNDLWLNEGFATWMARKNMEAWRPEWAAGWRSGLRRRSALAADRLMSARRVANPVESRNDLSGAFDSITYNKGAEVLSMFESWMGAERFRAGVRAYLDRHAFGSATSEDFLRAVAETSGRPEVAMAAFRSFLDQPGAPLIETRLECGGARPRLELSQRRFIPKGTAGEEHSWITPACFHYSAKGRVHKACTEVRGTQTLGLETKSCPAWVVGNADGAGHYLTRLDAATLQRLLPNIPRLPARDAVAFGNDTNLLLRTGLMGAAEALRVAERLLQHRSPGVKQAAVVMLEELREGMLSAQQRRSVAAMDSRQVLPLAMKVGWKPASNESLEIQNLRDYLLPYAAETAGGAQLRAEARALALRWIRDHGAIDSSVVRIVLRAAARNADAELFAQLMAAVPRAEDRRDRGDLVDALAAVRAPALRAQAFETLLPGGTLDGRDAFTFVRRGLNDKWNAEPLFDFLRARWDDVGRKLPPETGAWVMKEMAYLCTPGARDRFAAFFGPRAGAMLGGPPAYRQALESIDICVATLAMPVVLRP